MQKLRYQFMWANYFSFLFPVGCCHNLVTTACPPAWGDHLSRLLPTCFIPGAEVRLTTGKNFTHNSQPKRAWASHFVSQSWQPQHLHEFYVNLSSLHPVIMTSTHDSSRKATHSRAQLLGMFSGNRGPKCISTRPNLQLKISAKDAAPAEILAALDSAHS